MIDPLRPSNRHLLYTAGPIRGDQDRNVERARDLAIELRTAGWSVFCPHLNSVDIPGIGGLDAYLAEDFEVLARCDALVLLPNWQKSEGSLREIEFASMRGIPILDWRALLPDGRA